MKTEILFRRLKPVLVLVFVYGFALTAAAQNYYPADIGNTWVLESADADERRTYSLEGPETFAGIQVITLKIETEELSTSDVVDTDRYFLTVGSEDIKLHGTVLEEGTLGTITTNFPRPATFFPLSLMLGDQWRIHTEAVRLSILPFLSGRSTTNLEVVGFENLETPAGTFQNCAKVELALTFSAGGFANLASTTYQWLAPDVGPVQYQNSDGLIFKLVRTNLPTNPYDVNADGVVNILDLTFVASRFGESDPEADVNGDGIINILDLVLIAQNLSN